MDTQPVIPFQFTAGQPTGVVVLLALAALAVWGVASVRFSGRRSWPGRILEGGVRGVAGVAALNLILEAMSRWLTLSTPWPMPALALGGVLAIEAVRALYALECRAVPARVGRLLVALRLALVALLLLMLVQPVRIWETRRTLRREVAVLIDGSASMQVVDSGMSPGEKLRLAGRLGVPGAERSVRLEKPAAELGGVRQELGALADALAAAQAGGGDGARRSAGDADLRRRLSRASHQAQGVVDVLTAPVLMSTFSSRDPARGRLSALVETVRREAVQSATNGLPILEMASTNRVDVQALAACRDIQDRLRRSAAALADVEPQLVELGEQVDTAAAQALTGQVARAVESAASVRRCELAVSLLNSRLPLSDGRPGGMGDPTLARGLERDYGVRYFVFDSSVAPVDPELLRTNAAALFQAPAARGTDLAAAFAETARAFPPATLAGVLVFTDGRHQSPSSVEESVRPFQQKGVPIIPVVMGGWRKPPVDVGIMSMEAPDSVRTNERVAVTAMLKCDGVKGSNVQIRLYRDAVCVATQSVRVATDSLRKRLALADEPQSNGLFRYRLAVDAFPNEVTLTNNQASVPVMATDSQIRLLLVESRPRWEFRYLKNLFSGRDRSVRLQHVLLNPDTVRGLPGLPPIPASATRPEGEDEATALPVTAEEWMKFDVVVLGDVGPAFFTNGEAAVLARFVKERGGTLVVLSGPRAMPHAWSQSPVAALLPVTVAATPLPWLAAPEPSYQVQLTAEGRAHPMVKLAADAAENEAIWNRLPSLYWRHAVQGVKAGATVLLYARPENGPAAASGRAAATVPDEATLRAQRQFEAEHALLVLQPVGLGQVVFFAFDQTWRLRYWTGDAWHHTLWGQLVRGGAGEKLVSGDVFNRLGASRLRYAPGQSVRIRARLLQPDYTPRSEADARVEIWSGPQLVSRGNLEPVGGRTGDFERDFGALPEGDYRVVLREGDEARTVESGFSVMPEAVGELSELAADRGLLGRVAAQTGGRLIESWRLEDVRERLKAPEEIVTERRQWDLWDSWWLYALVAGLAGAEWLVRKKSGLI